MHGHVWSCMVIFCHVWSCMVLYGHVWSCMFMYVEKMKYSKNEEFEIYQNLELGEKRNVVGKGKIGKIQEEK